VRNAVKDSGNAENHKTIGPGKWYK